MKITDRGLGVEFNHDEILDALSRFLEAEGMALEGRGMDVQYDPVSCETTITVSARRLPQTATEPSPDYCDIIAASSTSQPPRSTF